jgi:hypothetical protein
MKNKKYYSVGTVLKSNRKVVERDKIDTSNKQPDDQSLSSHDTDASIKYGWVKLVKWAQTSPLSDITIHLMLNINVYTRII